MSILVLSIECSNSTFFRKFKNEGMNRITMGYLRHFALLLLLSLGGSVRAADYYWVNGTGNWSGAGITGYYFGGLANQATLDLAGELCGLAKELWIAGTATLGLGLGLHGTCLLFETKGGGRQHAATPARATSSHVAERVLMPRVNAGRGPPSERCKRARLPAAGERERADSSRCRGHDARPPRHGEAVVRVATLTAISRGSSVRTTIMTSARDRS